jgi:hypothetical protein
MDVCDSKCSRKSSKRIMAANTANPIPAIRTPDALRGLNSLVDRVCKIVTDRRKPKPVAKSA